MKKIFKGQVVSSKSMKTIIVEVTTKIRHPKYQKYLTKASKYMAHDENQVAKEGDIVEIVGCRPLSKSKRWRLFRVVGGSVN